MAGSRKYSVSKAQRADQYHRRRDERAMRRAHATQRHSSSYLSEDETLNCWKIKLNKLGLQLRDIPADGNCLFRALGDQMDGHSDSHVRHRADVCRFMLEHEEDFAPFVVDNQTFVKHLSNLRNPGTFAGNDALVAFARLHKVTIVIHQLEGAAFQIHGGDNSQDRELHLTYHNGEHYSSVRRIADKSTNPAFIKLKVQEKHCNEFNEASCETSDDVIDEIMASTGCKDRNLIEEAYVEHDEDIIITQDYIKALMLASESSSMPSHDNLAAQPSPGSTSTMDSGVWSESSEKSATKLPNSSAPQLPNTAANKPTRKMTKSDKKKEKKRRAAERHKANIHSEDRDCTSQAVYEVTTNMATLDV